ncbi:pirin family protein [Agrobacterium sp. AGB01]|uniref:pirin family protein n=1 Tax=Agrobacterium sp. AGB01 TaxID=2769302 RepID=UPI001783B03C|nr:pirin family protein [Agrobacterium sp. AGB01]MBD9388600.1 pirin family protein [Agrobacterium sp. AGB01]
MDTTKIKPEQRNGSWKQGCTIEVVYPGSGMGEAKRKILGITKIERSYSLPGFVAHMHQHQDDEILTCVRSGVVLHIDSLGHEQKLTPSLTTVVSAGHTFHHEERTLGRDPAEAYSIHFRPEPYAQHATVQFVETSKSHLDQWRLLASCSNAPLILRSRARVHDARLSIGRHLLPLSDGEDIIRVLIVLDGHVTFGDKHFKKGDIVSLADTEDTFHVVKPADLLLIASGTFLPAI